jgi:hypothetical protein
MEACPACKAPFKGGQTCHRCKSDLRPLIAVKERAAACLAAARAAFGQNDYQAAFGLACKSLALKRSEEAESICRYAGFLAGCRHIAPRDHDSHQFSNKSPGTRSNSLTLFVTNTKPEDLA